RLTQIDPLSSRAALGLMTALVAAGEPAAAIQHARAHEAHVEQELGAGPDAAILALVKQLCEDAERGSSRLGAASAPRRRQSPPVSVASEGSASSPGKAPANTKEVAKARRRSGASLGSSTSCRARCAGKGSPSRAGSASAQRSSGCPMPPSFGPTSTTQR